MFLTRSGFHLFVVESDTPCVAHALHTAATCFLAESNAAPLLCATSA